MAEWKKCNGPTEGFKCDVCGEESPVHAARPSMWWRALHAQMLWLRTGRSEVYVRKLRSE